MICLIYTSDHFDNLPSLNPQNNSGSINSQTSSQDMTSSSKNTHDIMKCGDRLYHGGKHLYDQGHHHEALHAMNEAVKYQNVNAALWIANYYYVKALKVSSHKKTNLEFNIVKMMYETAHAMDPTNKEPLEKLVHLNNGPVKGHIDSKTTVIYKAKLKKIEEEQDKKTKHLPFLQKR